MLLKSLLNNIDYKITKGSLDTEINEIRYDNRKVTDGDLFVCIKGTKADGHDFAEDALKKGAKVIVSEMELGLSGDYTEIIIENGRKALALISSNFFGNPSEKITAHGASRIRGWSTSSRASPTVYPVAA